jgi:NADP-dependent 3-hydroxy acid dehydrogenase YdfG
MKKTALITGATSGIGEAIARKFAHNDFNIIINGRRKNRLDTLAEELKQESGSEVFTLPFDVRVQKEVTAATDSLPTEWKNIDVLVNNAGLASGLDPLYEGKTEDWDLMIDTNLKGLLYVTHNVVPHMINRGSGYIINVGSIAGKEVYPNGNVYCATKHAVDALTKGMRIDLIGKGIKVSQICPGLVETEFSMVRFKGDEERAANVYKGYQPLNPMDIADIAFYLTTLPPHVCINDIVVTPIAQANAWLLERQIK